MSSLEKYHWLHGIDEYLTRTNHPHSKKYKRIQSAIQQGSPWSIRNTMVELINSNVLGAHRNEYVNIILAHHLEELKFTNEQILRFINSFVDDGFLVDIHKWVSIDEASVGRGDLSDHFSRGQIMSKLWMMEELRNVVSGNNLGTVVLYGGWYATVAHFFFKFFSPQKLYSIDLDPTTVEVADCFNARQGCENDWQFKAFAHDVGTITYNQAGTFVIPADASQMGIAEISIKPTVIVNTSCEHMDDEWFNNLPDGQFVVLQTNDYFDNPQHSNCVDSIEAALAKYKFSEVHFSGELQTYLYKRFMIIGTK